MAAYSYVLITINKIENYDIIEDLLSDDCNINGFKTVGLVVKIGGFKRDPSLQINSESIDKSLTAL